MKKPTLSLIILTLLVVIFALFMFLDLPSKNNAKEIIKTASSAPTEFTYEPKMSKFEINLPVEWEERTFIKYGSPSATLADKLFCLENVFESPSVKESWKRLNKSDVQGLKDFSALDFNLGNNTLLGYSEDPVSGFLRLSQTKEDAGIMCSFRFLLEEKPFVYDYPAKILP